MFDWSRHKLWTSEYKYVLYLSNQVNQEASCQPLVAEQPHRRQGQLKALVYIPALKVDLYSLCWSSVCLKVFSHSFPTRTFSPFFRPVLPRFILYLLLHLILVLSCNIFSVTLSICFVHSFFVHISCGTCAFPRVFCNLYSKFFFHFFTWICIKYPPNTTSCSTGSKLFQFPFM